ncbi:nitrogen fixation protein NifQ [soil metagenome]
MITTAPREQLINNPLSASLVPMVQPGGLNGFSGHSGLVTYRMLTGCEAADAAIEENEGFDRHVLASILAAAAMEEGGSVAGRAGLAAADFETLILQWFPLAHDAAAAWCLQGGQADDDEVIMVRDLLLSQRSTEGEAGRWLAAMIARRAIEPNHLWEDLGLRDRSELTRLLARHFGPLAVRNTRNMRWKRFFYRMLCEDDGLVMCSTPVCTNCNDFDLCFGDESGESRMAERRREVSLQTTMLAVSSSLQSFRSE